MFYPELALGAGALSTGRRRELQEFLVDVARLRRCPLHVANLWNALYFNYDLGSNGFLAGHLAAERIPTRTAQVRDFSRPVGAFVRVHTQASCGDLLAEVIYKEGAHPSGDEGWLPPELSGAPATATEQFAGQPVAVVRERFVLDLQAFGPDANHVTPQQYERLCRRARWLDGHGHLVMEAMYTPGEADLEDLDYYAQYLFQEHRDGLLAFCFNETLSDDELREALLRSFDAVHELAATASALRDWRGKYFFLASDYRRRLDYHGPLGGGDLQAIYHGMASMPRGENRCYSPVGPRVLEMLGRDGLSAEEQALVRGSSYAAAICHTNSYIADALTRDQRSGVLDNRIHLRLDDDWQEGGIWRAERVDDPRHYSLKALPATLPLHLGYAEAAGAAEALEATPPDEEPIAATQTGFKVPLTMRDRALQRLRLPTAAAEALAPGAVDIALRHSDLRDRYQVERDGSILYGVEYPWNLHPGIILHCNIEAGGSVVRVRTMRITPPVVASDGISFDYDTNIALYEREMRLEELPTKVKRDAPTLAELINRAFRLRGRLHDGWRALTLADLATIILGPAWRAADTRPIAEALASMGLAHQNGEYR
jgi:hypothetical protein